jgi:hypothetical protein
MRRRWSLVPADILLARSGFHVHEGKSPLKCENGKLRCPSGLGFGVTVDPDYVRKAKPMAEMVIPGHLHPATNGKAPGKAPGQILTNP